MKNIAVFASGTGTNFLAIHNAIRKKRVRANLAVLVCDNNKAGVIAKANKAGVKVVLITRQDYKDKDAFEAKLIQCLNDYKVELIVLAGFMRMLSAKFVKKYYGRMVNVHPSLLPSFKGTQAIKDAFEYGVKYTGVTVHFVDELMDHGPIITQEPVSINDKDSLDSLEKRIHSIEHKIYPKAIGLVISEKVKISGRKVVNSR